MDKEQIQQVSFEIILDSGEARTKIFAALASLRSYQFDKAAQELDQANASLVSAHRRQTQLLQQFANGLAVEMEIILVHAQDHLMSNMNLLEVAKEMMHLYEKMEHLEKVR